MKRILSLSLSLVLLCTLVLPCAAADTPLPKVREYTDFADVPQESWCYGAIQLCYETGLFNGASDNAFDPQGQLTAAHLMVLMDRLYNLQASGSLEIPALPEHPDSYVRFYDGENLVADFGDFCTMGYGPHQIIFSFSKKDIALGQESLRIEIGTAGAPPEITGEGRLDPDTAVYESREYNEATGEVRVTAIPVSCYIFELDEDVDSGDLCERLAWYDTNTDYYVDIWEEWWFPAAYDLLIRHEEELRDVAAIQYPHVFDLRTEMDTPICRQDFAIMLWSVCQDLEPINQIVSIPDIDPADYPAPYEHIPAAILALYNAGILTGTDARGSFSGSSTLTRAQAAVMLARVLDPSLRVVASENN